MKSGLNRTEYLEDEEGVYPSLSSMPTLNSLQTWLLNSPSTLGSIIILSN